MFRALFVTRVSVCAAVGRLLSARQRDGEYYTKY